MAWFGANKTKAYQTYPEPGYGGIGYPDYDIVGFSATQNSQSYVATTEQVVEFKRFPSFGDHPKHSPTRKDLYHETWDKPMTGPYGPARDKPEKARDFSPKFGNNPMIHQQNKGSPKNTHDHYGKYNNFSDDDDDYDDDYDGITKNNNNDYNAPPPSYTRYHETPNPSYSSYSPPSSYTVPLNTPPPPPPPPPTTKDHNTYNYEKSNNYDRLFLNNPPPPVKTRTDTGRAREFATESPKNSPVSSAKAKQTQFMVASPKKYDIHQGYQETIDSAEARRRYGRGPQRAGSRLEEKYIVTIDSREAARKYNGVFVPN
ncbi:hypothetical protein ABFS82_10G137100 [Erythranthe guttata]|uniref:actin cytoskeleton-regulatory complex protein pan1-like n=1 Tax=Erythranthe guttata TaxID=4155 RepID=UPI00064D9C36|nr:PREDICTED: actin cytoskeleton-regulatory complex protein pan1-like [Erythranthe guttata]|eukprot:XP_012831281.1 PREDICTED: actin cytoskeleton-regulatory complex protein pan1-like [Erythranthe guttata]